MAGNARDPSRETLIRRAVREATRTARDDAEFVRILRARLVGQAGARARSGARPVGFAGSGRAARAGATAGRSEHRIYRDPRFAENARFLARSGPRVRILGGSQVRGRVFDDCVAVGNDERFGCTGTLIAPRVVLTAGHCATLATRIFVGNDVDRRGQVYEVAKAMRHPRYGRPAHANDLLILLLKRPVDGVVPRAIASSALIDSARIGRAVGFGNTEETGSIGYGIKRQVDIPIASNACAGRVDGDSDARVYGCIARHEIVAGKSMLARDSCTGDSGGPFYVADSRGAWQLAGATSRATDTAGSMCGDGGIYVRIDAYLAWIQKAAKIRLRPAETPRRPARRPKPRKPPRKPRRPKAKPTGRRGLASPSTSPQGKRGRGR